MTDLSAGAALMTAAELDHLRTEGYVVVRNRLPDVVVDGLRSVIEEAVDTVVTRWHRDGLIKDTFPSESFLTRWARVREQLPSQSPTGWRGILVNPTTYGLWRRPELTALARSHLGDELWAHDIWTCRPREPNSPGQKIGWHQDVAYFRDWTPEDGQALTFWMTLVDATEQAGCLQIAPRSHLRGRLDVAPGDLGLIWITEDEIAAFEPVTVECAPGDVLIFTDHTAHCSLPNRSDYVRWTFDIRFTEATPGFRTKAPGGFVCHTAGDPSAVTTFEEWAAKYDIEHGVFGRYWSRRRNGDEVPEEVAREYDLYY
jgi:hypothetical protein